MATEDKKLVVIDGKSVFYRGYYAMPNLSTRDGTPTGGVYGFAMLALQILKKLEPDYVIVAWDKSKTNIRARRKLYPEYKANRKPMPDDMREQIPVLQDVLKAFSWPLLECDDFEADDIMATLGRQAKAKGLHTTLVTSDLDVLQAIDGNVDAFLLKRGLTNVVRLDRKAFTEEYGVTPEQFIDIKALKGDSSDNVPGVAGVGEKTAKELVQQYGTLEGVYNNLDKIKDTLKAKLEKNKDMAFLSHKLLEIRFDAPVKLDLKAADATDANPKEIAELFDKLEFRRLITEMPSAMRQQQGELQQAKVASSVKAVTVDIKRIEDMEALNRFIATKPKELLLLTLFQEPVVTNINQIREVLLTADGKTVYIVSPSQRLALKNAIRALKPLLEDKKVTKFGYDIKADAKAWLDAEVEIQGINFDTMVAALIINPLLRGANLEQLAKDALNIELPTVDRSQPAEEITAGLIVAAIWKLRTHQHRQLGAEPKVAKLAEDIEWPLLPILARMEYTGIQLDSDYLKKMSTRFAKRIAEIEKSIYREAKQEFNISSPQQLSTVLFEKLRLPIDAVKKTKTGISTAASELGKLRGLHPIIDLISQYREFTKLKSTYVDPLPQLVDSKSRLHTTFNQIGSQTGRLSSDHPNLMNIPVRTEAGREIRRAFVAGPGNVLISADYSQFELRLAAVLAKDKNMEHAFNQGVDIHTQTAAIVYDVNAKDVTKEQRYNAKAVNFGIMYGLSAHGLSQATGMVREEAQAFIDKYFEVRRDVLKYLESLKDQAKKHGYVETMFGRRRPMPDIKSSNFMVRRAAERAAMNMPIQGTEADLMKMAMIEINKKIDHNCQMLLQIHDSILVECKKSASKRIAKLLKDTMENVYKLPVKLDVDVTIGTHWGEL